MTAHAWRTSYARSSRSFGAAALILAALLFSPQPALAQFSQLGAKLVGTGAVGQSEQGAAAALSADGNTAIVGGPGDNGNTGAAWIYTFNSGVWTQQAKLIGTGGGAAQQGASVAISADGNTAIIGGPHANSNAGAAWIFTRSGNVWTEQGSKLAGTGGGANAGQGYSVSISADGNTAIVGAPGTASDAGAAWIFVRSGSVWTQQGGKLVGTGASGAAVQGWSVALSADGATALVGGPDDKSGTGAAWVYTLSGGGWTQQGGKLVGTGAGGAAYQGSAVALSADGNTAIVGGPDDKSNTGAAWILVRSGGVWTQQGAKLVGTGAMGAAYQGTSVALSADGNTAIMGGYADNGSIGAFWALTRSGTTWTQRGNKLVGVGTVGDSEQGTSVALSADGNIAIVGGLHDNGSTGAAWIFVQPALRVTPATNMIAAVYHGAPSPLPSFQYQVSATISSGFNYSISGVPTWLTASSTGGNTGTTSNPQSVTFTVNTSNLDPGTYGPTTITFTNTDTGQGTQTRTATLTVNPPALQVTPATNIVAAGNPGGPFAPASFQYQIGASVGSFNYSISGVPTWLTASSTGGNTGTTPSVTFTVNSSIAKGLAAGTYGPTTITFTNTDTGQGTQSRSATLTVNPLGLQVTPTTGIVASGMQGGAFSPSSFGYTLSAPSGSAKYSITNVPSWLTASSTSGSLTTAAKTITFKIASGAANKLTPAKYLGSINFNNTTTNQVDATVPATLTVAPKDYTIKLSASPSADGAVSGAGTFVGGTSQTVKATPANGHSFVHWTKGGTVVSTSASYTFTLSANVTLVADFK
jgi:Divergent InlB B-repeat domain